MSEPLAMWMPAAISCGVVVLICLVVARMARTVEQRLIDVDLAHLEQLERQLATSAGVTSRAGRRAVDQEQRAERLRSIADHHRVADYLIIAVVALLASNAVLYVAWMVPALFSMPLIALLALFVAASVFLIRRTPSYVTLAAAADPTAESGTGSSR